jgi:hypothetical protein
MKNPTKKAFILFFTLLISHISYSQFHVAFKFSSINKIGLGYSFSDRLWTEFSIYDGYYSGDFSFTPEIVFCYNLVKKEKHDIYVGLGGIINHYTGVTLPIGTQIYPFEKFRRLSINAELHPILNVNNYGQYLIFQANCGFRYCFRDNKKK